MALANGTRAFVAYDLPGDPLYHERRVMASCACQRGWHAVLTPDLDLYEEQFSLENTDVSAFHIAPPGDGTFPYGLGAHNTYQFRGVPDPQLMAQLELDARHAAAAFQYPPGAGAGLPPVAAALPARLDPPAAPDGRWVRIESVGVDLRGSIVELDGTELLRGELGLKQKDGAWFAIRKMPEDCISGYKGSEAAGDARLLGIKFQGIQRQERWRKSSKTGVFLARERPLGACVSSTGATVAQWIITGGG